MITLGEKGAYYFDRKESGVVPGFVVKAVDPTAAGDAFIGGFAVRILEGDSLKEAILYANAAGALAATKQGAQPSLPTKRDIEKFMDAESSLLAARQVQHNYKGYL